MTNNHQREKIKNLEEKVEKNKIQRSLIEQEFLVKQEELMRKLQRKEEELNKMEKKMKLNENKLQLTIKQLRHKNEALLQEVKVHKMARKLIRVEKKPVNCKIIK